MTGAGRVSDGTGARRLPATHGSLARGASAPLPGTVFALALTGGMTLGPGEGREVLFGRNRPEVHVCLGEDDPQVSRHQGTLTHRNGLWWVSNSGRLPTDSKKARATDLGLCHGAGYGNPLLGKL